MCTDEECKKAVHVRPTYGKPHDTEKVCWCTPDLEDYRPTGGLLLVIHREQN